MKITKRDTYAPCVGEELLLFCLSGQEKYTTNIEYIVGGGERPSLNPVQSVI